MKRDVEIDEISDGKLYGLNDMVKAGCHDCEGCHACCQAMGKSVILDPLDMHRLVSNLGQPFEALLEDKIELNIVDGIILPNLKMTGADESCGFLNSEGRCAVHSFRPGVCRLFPLGRYYENGGFKYFLQVNECRKENRTKVKVRKWIDTPDISRYEQFIMDWHNYLKAAEAFAAKANDDGRRKAALMDVLNRFYVTPFHPEKSFYDQFNERLEAAKASLAKIQAVAE